ncbi:MAG TPA: class I SAM-dependent methyltransferase [Candidatus Limnocylindrales bacterium]|jgi:hypothetical protein
MKSARNLHAAFPFQRVVRIPAYLRSLATLIRPDIVRFLPIWVRHVRHVRGWLRLPDAFLLYRLARARRPAGDIVEIGSAWGRSTVCLAAGSRSVRAERILAIDPHTGDDWFLEETGQERIDSLAEFQANVDGAGLHDWVTPLVTTSELAARERPAGPIRLLFIDGLHTLEGVQRDIADWVPRVAPGGVIVFDDYDNTADGVGVRVAVDRLLDSGLVEPTLRRAFNLVWTYRVASPDRA